MGDTPLPLAGNFLANVRRRREPAPDDPNAIATVCRECEHTYYRRKGEWWPRCASCAETRATAAQLSMRNRAGPYYERAVIKAHAYWHGELVRLGLVTTESPPQASNRDVTPR